MKYFGCLTRTKESMDPNVRTVIEYQNKSTFWAYLKNVAPC